MNHHTTNRLFTDCHMFVVDVLLCWGRFVVSCKANHAVVRVRVDRSAAQPRDVDDRTSFLQHRP